MIRLLQFISVFAMITGSSSVFAQSVVGIEIADEDQHVTVIVNGLARDKTTDVANHSDRIDVGLTGRVVSQRYRFRDKTIKLVNIIGGSSPRLSIQLRHGRRKTKKIAGSARFSKIDNGFALRFVRRPATVIASVHPTSELVAAEEVGVPNAAESESEELVSATVGREAEGPDHTSTPPPTESVGEVAKTVVAPTIIPVVSPARAEDSGGFGVGLMITLIVLSGCAGLIWYVKRNQVIPLPTETLDVVASRSMGAKSRVSLLNAGDRQFLLGVSDKGVQLLSQWRRSPTAEASPLGEMGTDFKPTIRSTISTRTGHKSPAVAGLVALRSRTDFAELNEEVATGDEDADAEWVKELMNATRNTRGVS